MRPTLLLPLSAFLLCGAAPLTHAAALDDGAIVDKDEQVWTVNADGSAVLERQVEIRVVSAALVNALAQQRCSYNATLATCEFTEAYTQKPDGRRVVVARDRIRDMQASDSAGAGIYHDERVKVALFPQVAPGDRLVMHMRHVQLRPLFAGHFQQMSTPPIHPVGVLRIVYDLPAGMTLYADARGYVARSVAAADGRRRYQYEFNEHPRQQPDEGALGWIDHGDRLLVSTLPDHAALAAAYQRGLAGKTAVTPAVRALQQRVVQGIAGTRAQALALADWVRTNIRYLAVHVGDGGVVPHAAEDVLAAGYGDCKDQATLLEALFDAAGIPSTQALISSGDAYTLPAIDALAVLNHVINYVPGLDLFFDTTASNVALGYLPEYDLGKIAVLTRTGEDRRTPSSQLNKVTTETWYRMDEPGFDVYTLTRTKRGAAAAQEEKPVVQESVRMATRQPDPKSISVYPGMSTHDGLLAQALTDRLRRGMHPDACQRTSRDIEEIFHVPVPHGYQVDTLPPPVDLHTARLDYASQAVEADGEVLVKRRYREHLSTAPCTPDESQALGAMRPEMLDSLASAVVFKRQ